VRPRASEANLAYLFHYGLGMEPVGDLLRDAAGSGPETPWEERPWHPSRPRPHRSVAAAAVLRFRWRPPPRGGGTATRLLGGWLTCLCHTVFFHPPDAFAP